MNTHRIHCCVAYGCTGATKCEECGSTIRWLDVAPPGYRCCDCRSVCKDEARKLLKEPSLQANRYGGRHFMPGYKGE